jgi:hypothetical protein
MVDDNQSAAPEAYLCPITHVIMTDPVSDPDGNSYERSAINEWLVSQQVSPLTRQPLRADQLVPNRALKEAIESWHNQSAAADAANNQIVDQAQSSAVAVEPTLHVVKDGQFVLAKVAVPDHTQRTPIDVCCVIDVSGSMQVQATIPDSGKEKVSRPRCFII